MVDLRSAQLSAPHPLEASHQLAEFSCQHASLAHWLKHRAMDNQLARASRTWVVADTGQVVIGYYALAAAVLEHAQATGALRRNMPSPIPAVLLARLAVDDRWQGQGLGAALLADALRRALAAATLIGARALLAHTVDDTAEAFYLHHGFQQAPFDARLVMLDLAKLE